MCVVRESGERESQGRVWLTRLDIASAEPPTGGGAVARAKAASLSSEAPPDQPPPQHLRPPAIPKKSQMTSTDIEPASERLQPRSEIDLTEAISTDAALRELDKFKGKVCLVTGERRGQTWIPLQQECNLLTPS